jgi:hypothetical protein
MENKPQIKKRSWSYITSGLVYALGVRYGKTTIDGIIILVVAISAGFLYYFLKSKLKIKNETIKIILTLVVVLSFSAFMNGFLSAILNRLIHI